MKALFRTVFYTFLSLFLGGIVVSPSDSFAQSVTFNSSYVEFDTEKNGEMGMTIHYDFVVHNLLNKNLRMLAFVVTSDKELVKSYRDEYKTNTGHLCSVKSDVSIYENCHWEDMKFFIPYDAMPIADAGEKYFYSMVVRLADGTDIQTDNSHEFDWASHSPSATIKNIWTDHNIDNGGEKGMYIHSNITVHNDKGNDIEFVCFFYDAQGNSVHSTRKGYQTVNDDLCTATTNKSDYQHCNWGDLKLFLPYDALPSIPGKVDYYFVFQARDTKRDYAVLARSEKQHFYCTTPGSNNSDNNNYRGNPPTLEWLSSTMSNTSSYTMNVGVRSTSEVASTSVTVNGSVYRGMQSVQGNGYALTINKSITLQPGSNTIVVSATNAGGTTTEQYTVLYKEIGQQSTGDRVALVIGNARYQGNPLSNPVNDAEDISASLRRLGFQVKTVKNGTRREMDEAIVELGQRAKAGGVALFYYSGHGIQNNGHNYLIPIGANLASAADLEYECTDVNRVLSNMEASGCKMNIVVLDACRDNPFAKSWSRSAASGGLTEIKAPVGTFIAYATSPGSVAIDGTGKHSPFTEAFLNTLKVPGLSLLDFYQQVQESVQLQTEGSQVPWMSSSFLGKFYFNPSK